MPEKKRVQFRAPRSLVDREEAANFRVLKSQLEIDAEELADV